MTDRLRAAAEAALEALEDMDSDDPELNQEWLGKTAITKLRAALAEQSPEMPSSTRYTVAVEGRAPTYWDNVHDAITNAQRAVYAGVHNTWNAINNLQSGQIAEWSYGFSAVRIYPPQRKSAPSRREWVSLTDEEIAKLIPNTDAWNYEIGLEEAGDFARAIEQKLKDKNT